MRQNAIADERAAQMAHTTPPPKHGLMALPDKVLAAFHANGDTTSAMSGPAVAEAARVQPAVQTRGDGAVVVDAGKRVTVPAFRGSGLRDVVGHAMELGLRVQTLGSGVAQDQVPAAGTSVPPGTEIVVRFAR